MEAKEKFNKRHTAALQKLGRTAEMQYRKRGRKTLFRPHMMDEGPKLAAYGMTMDEIAEFWNIHRATLYRWAQKHHDFRDSIKRARAQADVRIQESLYNRAKGYKYKESYYEMKPAKNGGESKLTLVKEVEKTMAPDPTAIIFWLTNRQPEHWRHKKEVALSAKDKLPLELILTNDVKPKSTGAVAPQGDKALAPPSQGPSKP